MNYARKMKFFWLDAGPYILASCLFIGVVGSSLPGKWGVFFAAIALAPIWLILAAVILGLAALIL